MKKTTGLLLLCFICLFFLSGIKNSLFRNTEETTLSIIPAPFRVEPRKGTFTVDSKTRILVDLADKKNQKVAFYLEELFRKSTGLILKVYETSTDKNPRNTISFRTSMNNPELGDEGYILSVSSRSIDLEANTSQGFFYAVQTLRQLLPVEFETSYPTGAPGGWTIPCVDIIDKPRFRWRGMMLDVCRHFFSKQLIFDYLDYLAMYKFNTFHLHLTDDQGWRLEIKKYPKLTSVGGWRADRLGQPWWYRLPQGEDEEATYGGYFSQEDIKEIIQYAESRFITVIPEIEMPGHSRAALAAYPQYSCSGKPLKVSTGGELNDNTFCAGNESTFEFLEDILSEVADLFPAEYIHIGGDECNKTAWKSCRKCRERMKKEGLKDVDELQSYFIKRIESILRSKNKKMIGWDEILEGGLAPNATVMSWRGMDGGIAAALSGHDVIMAPNTHTYFDLYQGEPELEPETYSFLPLSRVYKFDPVPDTLTLNQRDHILGGHGCLWTEFVTDREHAEYMTFPRLLALSEVVWTPPRLMEWSNFVGRMEDHFFRLDAREISYSQSAYNVSFHTYHKLEEPELLLFFSSEIDIHPIHYTLDGTEPTKRSQVYREPLKIKESGEIRAAVFINGQTFGKTSKQKVSYHKGLTKHVTLKHSLHRKIGGGWPGALTDGLQAEANFSDSDWRGIRRYDLEAEIDLERMITIDHISASFLQNIDRRIFLPEWVEFSVSTSGQRYEELVKLNQNIPQKQTGEFIYKFSYTGKSKRARYVRIRAKNLKTCPDWHRGAGESAWLYVDELIIN